MSSQDPIDELITLAKEARDQAYAPYSRFRVGAALRAASGRVHSGCNVENASYGLAICAERVVVFKAVSEGESRFTSLAVVSETMASPCGACRQVLAEFGLDAEIIVADLEEQRKVLPVTDLLPDAFTPKFLPRSGSESREAAC